MVIKKDLVIAVLSTFCLTATLFMIMPTRSSPGIKDYDPWYDVNDDGVIDMADISLLVDYFLAAGPPINKTALLLELQSRVAALETRMPRKGHIIISPIAFTPASYLNDYFKYQSFIYGGSTFYADLQLPNGATITNMTAKLYDGYPPERQIKLTLYRHSLDDNTNEMALILYYGTGAPGVVYWFVDTIDYPIVDNQNYMYGLQLWFEVSDYYMRLCWVQLDYEYT